MLAVFPYYNKIDSLKSPTGNGAKFKASSARSKIDHSSKFGKLVQLKSLCSKVILKSFFVETKFLPVKLPTLLHRCPVAIPRFSGCV